MASLFNATGTVVSARVPEFKTDNAVLEVKVSVRTGEPKKDGEEYAPSYLVQGLLWGKYATAMTSVLDKGQRVFISGQLGLPNVYTTEDGTTVVTQRLHRLDTVEVLGEGNNSSNQEQAPAAKATTKKKSAKAEILGDDELDELF